MNNDRNEEINEGDLRKIKTILGASLNYKFHGVNKDSADIIRDRRFLRNIKKEKSRRNSVYSVNIKNLLESEMIIRPANMENIADKIIIKIFKVAEKRSIQNEKTIYSIFEGIDKQKEEEKGIHKKSLGKIPNLECHYSVPRRLAEGDDFLVLEYIDGINLMDLFQTKISELKASDRWWGSIFKALINWFEYFIKASDYVPNDVHIRNFILYEPGGEKADKEESGANQEKGSESGMGGGGSCILYGIDFEELIKCGSDYDRRRLEIKAIASLMFSILASDPGIIEGLKLDYKEELIKYFIEEILNDTNSITNFIEEPSDKLIIIKEILNAISIEGRNVLQRRLRLGRINNRNIQGVILNLEKIIKNIYEESVSFNSMISDND
ncbi:MAG: hypothetical protein ACTSU2_10070 [Promethearchaeota archaeon]